MMNSQALRTTLYPLKVKLFGVWSKFQSTAPRHENPYATHLPFLFGLSRLLHVRRVLELGSGLYTTWTFLDRAVFPSLEVLTSLENDLAWKDRIERMTADPRLDFRFVDSEISYALDTLNLEAYDLIFIDDSTRAEDRVRTIQAVARRKRATVIMLHDYEVQAYQRAVKSYPHSFPHIFKFKALNPHTAVSWPGTTLARHDLRSLNRLVKQHAQVIHPTERQGWIEVFDDFGWPQDPSP